MSGADQTLTDDGLPARLSGDWIRRKHHYLRRYCDMFCTAMRGKWHLTYLDLLAGPGVCRLEDPVVRLPGYPLLALECPFDDYRFFEADPVLAQALRERVAGSSKHSQCEVNQCDWVAAVTSAGFRKPQGLTLAFVDPTGIRQVPWHGMAALGALTKIDILMTIQHGMGIRLNVHQYRSREDETAADRFVGGTEWRAGLPSPDPCRLLLENFTDRMASLGFDTRKWQCIRNSANAELYYLCLFSRHDLALRFWDQVVRKDEKGQRVFDL